MSRAKVPNAADGISRTEALALARRLPTVKVDDLGEWTQAINDEIEEDPRLVGNPLEAARRAAKTAAATMQEEPYRGDPMHERKIETGAFNKTYKAGLKSGMKKALGEEQLTFTGGIKRAALKSGQPTPQDREEFKRRFPEAGVSLKRDRNGVFVTTHRSRSASYPSVAQIPKDRVRFIESTG